jgi:hypothetical protein
VASAVSGPVDCDPLVGLAPLQLPLAVQEVALVADQVSVELLPDVMALGPALRVTVGAGVETVTVAVCAALPPGPVQVSVKDWSLVKLPVEAEPLVGSLPLQPPEAVQEVAFVEVQLKVAPLPLVTVLGFAEIFTVGADWVTETLADCEALPPAPVQVIVKVVLAFNAPVDCEPLTARLPLQPPLAVQDVALVADHVNVELPPAVIDDGLACKVTVGAAADAVTVAVCDALPPGPVQVRV